MQPSVARRFAACACIVWIVPLLLIGFFLLPPQYDETYLAALQDKTERLDAAEGRRIVLIGGSGIAFDVRSDLLEQELSGYTVVNYGLYAGLGTTVMLHLAEPSLRAGDLVVFLPEQSEQTLSTFFSALTMWQAAEGDVSLLLRLSKTEAESMAGAFASHAAGKARLFFTGEKPTGDAIYARRSFNAYGDVSCAGREQNRMPNGFDENVMISFDPAWPTDEFFNAVNGFSARCEKKGIAVYYGFCPMNAAALPAEETDRLDAFVASLSSRLDCPILGDPHAAILHAGWFFDTNFHLNAAGQIAYTAQLAADLKTVLGDASPVGIEIPAMPALQTAALQAGDNSDADCFLYERAGETYRIVGLSKEGRTRTVLTVPTQYDGLPVIGFSADTFAENATLTILTLQNNIQSIPDGAFSGCTELSRIALRNPSPENCSVGKGLLDGTDALLYVPQAHVSAYLTNYFWSIHASRIRPDASLSTEQDVAFASSYATDAPTAAGERPLARSTIRYDGNGGASAVFGGTVDMAIAGTHLRENTLQGGNYFSRDGYVLLGWNTAPDGSGAHIGLGSRVVFSDGLTLYAEWAAASPASDFSYSILNGEVTITGYSGECRCVLPETIEDCPVRYIAAGAFSDKTLTLLVLPSGLWAVEDGAFSNCTISDLYLFDSLRTVSDASFAGSVLSVLHINAAVAPTYSGSYFDTFSDKYDVLLTLSDMPKLVLFSGSSGRYGYDTPAMERAFPAYRAINMGVYAYTNALPQMELLLANMQPGDVLLSAPEFDAVQEQFCGTNALDAGFWAMMESNYDAASELDLTRYANVFDSFATYQKVRSRMPGRNYGESPAAYDDDGNRYDFPTYNRYGDFILPRPNSPRDERLRHNIADYTTESISSEAISSLNAVYRRFVERGIAVYFSYTPRNRSSLSERSTLESRSALHEKLCVELEVPVISQIEDYLFSGIYFWLIDSHLSTEGVQLRTERIIRDLSAVLQ